MASISKCAAISAALAWVRLAITMRAGRYSFNTGITPRTAPPAPSSKTVLPDSSTPSLFEISSVSPSPSVLSPRILPFSSKISVLTAPAANARSECSSDKANASCLNGTVTFAPRPPSAKNASPARNRRCRHKCVHIRFQRLPARQTVDESAAICCVRRGCRKRRNGGGQSWSCSKRRDGYFITAAYRWKRCRLKRLSGSMTKYLFLEKSYFFL